MRRTLPTFSRLLWYWTNGRESLYDLTIEELYTFELLVAEASK